MRLGLRAASLSIGWYTVAVDAFCQRFRRVGKFIDERPFLTGAIIKAPMRLEFVAKKLLGGDMVGATVGLSWMILGDGALALNDEKLRDRIARPKTGRAMATILRNPTRRKSRCRWLARRLDG